MTRDRPRRRRGLRGDPGERAGVRGHVSAGNHPTRRRTPVAARRHGVVSTAPKGSSGSGGRQRFLRGATFTVAPMNPSTAKKLLGPAIAAVAAAGVLTAPFALAGGGGGGGGVPPAAQVGTDLAVVLSPTTA